MEQKHDNGLVSNCIGNNELQDLTAWIVLVPGTVVAVVSLLRSMSLIKKNVLKLCAQLESVVSFARCSTQYLYISSGNEMTVRLALTALVTADFTTPVHAYSQRSSFYDTTYLFSDGWNRFECIFCCPAHASEKWTWWSIVHPLFLIKCSFAVKINLLTAWKSCLRSTLPRALPSLPWLCGYMMMENMDVGCKFYWCNVFEDCLTWCLLSVLSHSVGDLFS